MRQEEDQSTRTQQEREEHDSRVMREGGTLSNGQEIYTRAEREDLRKELRRQNEEAQAALDKVGRRGMHPRVAAIRAELAEKQRSEEKTMATPREDRPDQTKFYKEKDAIAEGWMISSADEGFQMQKLDAPEEWPGFDKANGRVFETDQEVYEHVVARAWAGSKNHRDALNFLKTAAPEEYARTGDEKLQDASYRYRQEESARSKENAERVRSETDADPDLEQALQAAFVDLMDDVDKANRARPGLKDFEGHHAIQVAREAFMAGYLDTGTAEGALDAARRRMLITATPHEFYREALAEPEKDPDSPSL